MIRIMKFDHFLQHICPELGLNWRKYRRKGARRGVLSRMTELSIATFEDYIDYIRLHPEEGTLLPDIMHITVTRFHRDRLCWEELTKILPELIDPERTTRILSAGCCGGEEPYTMAIVWKELFEDRFGSIEILAIDIDEPSLKRAHDAIYDKWSLRELPEQWREKWFIKSGKRFRVSKEITRMVHFEHAHLIHDPLHGPFDLILCRNLFFTYFIKERRFQATRRLWEALKSGGALMIGEKEGLGPKELELFKPWPQVRCVFQKKDKAREMQIRRVPRPHLP